MWVNALQNVVESSKFQVVIGNLASAYLISLRGHSRLGTVSISNGRAV